VEKSVAESPKKRGEITGKLKNKNRIEMAG
jgi:hypothetical protein